jgi:dsRNA-specific ribonuclease
VGAQLPGVQTDWATCSASYPDMSSEEVTELEQVVAEERSLPAIATDWATAVQAWHGVPTTNATLKALVALADKEAPEVAKLTTLTPLAVCDVAATWKAHSYTGQSLADAFEAWIATAGLDETVAATTHADLARLVPQLKRLGVDYNDLDTLNIFFF